MLRERQKSILSAAIQEYVKTARPVASTELLRHFRLGISPATVRNEMQALDELGYLEQPHTSAGRVPTDKGYRFFRDSMPEGFLSESEEKLLEDLFHSVDEIEEFTKEFARALSQISGTFAAVGAFEEDVFYETGFGKIAEEPEFYEPARIQAFGRLADLLDDHIRELFAGDNRGHEEQEIYIGEENPLREAQAYSMVLSSWRHPRGFSGFFTAIGPKRADYKKYKAIIQTITKINYE